MRREYVRRATGINAGCRLKSSLLSLDHFLGDDSLKIMAKQGEFVTRKGIYPPIPDVDKIQIVEMDELDTNGFAEKRKEFRKIFFQ